MVLQRIWYVLCIGLTISSSADDKNKNIKQDRVQFTVFTCNCYAFPKDLTKHLKGISGFFGHEVDLASGIKKSISTRIQEIAQLIKFKDPDIAVFQELWKNSNKREMQRALEGRYPYFYWVDFSPKNQASSALSSIGSFIKTAFTHPKTLGEQESYTALNPFKVDSGLMIASKFPLLDKRHITFKDRAGDEVNAHKGALMVAFNDRNGDPVLLAVTHLQSWRDLAYVKIRQSQMRQLGKSLEQMKKEFIEKLKINKMLIASSNKKNLAPTAKEFSQLDEITCLVLGDMNEPLVYQAKPQRLLDRSTYLSQALTVEGIAVSNKEMIRLLTKKYKIKEYAEVRQLEKDGRLYLSNPSRVEMIGASHPLYPFIGRFVERANKSPDFYDYFEDASDNRGIQILDYFLLSRGSRIQSYYVLRQEVLGDMGPQKPYDPEIALSDHAAAIITVIRP